MKWYLIVAGLGIVGIGIVYGSQIAKKIEEAKFKGGFGLPFDFSSLFESYRGLQSQMIGKVKEIVSGGQEIIQTIVKTVETETKTKLQTETKIETKTSVPPERKTKPQEQLLAPSGVYYQVAGKTYEAVKDIEGNLMCGVANAIEMFGKFYPIPFSPFKYR
ncbi:MAG: hypothetical protein QXG39_04865 [Candidatus Aenigmatarchaeota archaeon]